MKKILIMALLIGVLIPSLAQAQTSAPSVSAVAYGIKELKTIEFDYGYLSTCAKNTWCNRSFSFYPSDSVSTVLSSLVRIVIEQGNNEHYEILVNDQPCLVSNLTNIVGKSQYVADFKCGNIINGEGNYTTSIRMTADGNVNIHFRTYITYINDPLTCEIGSTETFDTNETIVFTTFVRENATANLTIWDDDQDLVYTETFNSTGEPIIKYWETDVKGQYYAQLECHDERGNDFTNYGFSHFIVYPQTFEVIFNNTENITYLLEDLSDQVTYENEIIKQELSYANMTLYNYMVNDQWVMNDSFDTTWQNQADLKDLIERMDQNMTLYFYQSFDNQTKIYDYLVSMNGSIHDELFSIQYDLQSLSDRVILLESNMNDSFDQTWDELDLIQSDLATIDNKLDNITSEIEYTQILMLGVNDSIHSRLDSVDQDLQDIEDLIYAHNSSVFNEISIVISKLDNITTDLDLIQSDIDSIEIQLAGISYNITDLKDTLLIVESNIKSEIAYANSTIHSRFDSVDSDLTTIQYNVLILSQDLASHNNTMNARFDQVDYKLDNINVTLIDSVVNVNIPEQLYTNVTNESIQAISEEVILKMLESARILNDRVINFHNDEYCISNVTLRHNITYEFCTGASCRPMIDIMDEVCDYGCDLERNICKESPFRRNLIIFIGVVVLLFIVLIILGRR